MEWIRDIILFPIALIVVFLAIIVYLVYVIISLIGYMLEPFVNKFKNFVESISLTK